MPIDLASKLFTLTGDLVCVAGSDGYFKLLNPAFETVLGYTRMELLAQPLLLLFHEDDRDMAREAITRLSAGQTVVDFDMRVRTKRGDCRWISWHAVPEPDGSFYAIGRDITDRRAEQEALARMSAELERLATTDELTGLHNRRGFTVLAEHQAALARRHRWPLVVFAIDMDGLKGINDRGGHHVGDAAIRAAADVLRSVFRESDLLGRLGGDEFVVLLVNATLAVAAAFEARLAGALGRMSQVEFAGAPLSLSVGSALFDPARKRSLDDVLRRADAAMYERKRQLHESRTPSPPGS